MIAKVAEQDSKLLGIIKQKDYELVARKVTRHSKSLRVVLSPAICKMLLAELGDSIIFGLTPTQGVISISAIKGGGDFPDSRRTG